MKVTFQNGATATIAVSVAIGALRSLIFSAIILACRHLPAWAALAGGAVITWAVPLFEGYVIHYLLVAAGLMSCNHCVIHGSQKEESS